MEENSTTAEGNSNSDANTDANAAASTTGNESNATDNQTGNDNNDADNLDSSKSTDENSADGDKPADEATGDAPASQFDNDLDDWAEKTGRKVPETDTERQYLQEIRNGQREYSKAKAAEKAQAEINNASAEAKPEDSDDDDSDDPLENRVKSVEEKYQAERTARLQSEYFAENNVSDDEAKAMGDFLKEKVSKAVTPERKKEVYQYWTNPDNLSDWHAIAKSRVPAGVDRQAVADEAARKERERIAKESHSNGPNRNASQSQDDKSEDQKRHDRLLEKWKK